MKYLLGVAALAVANVINFSTGVSIEELEHEQITLEQTRAVVVTQAKQHGVPTTLILRAKVQFITSRYEECTKFKEKRSKLICKNTFLRKYIKRIENETT